MLVLCLDPSFQCFGWALVEDSAIPKVVKTGTIKSPPDKTKTQTERLKNIITEFIPLLDTPNFILREKVVGSQSASACRLLSLLEGAIVGVVAVKGISCEEYRARDVKLALTGNKDATKEEIISSVNNFFGDCIFENKKVNKKTKEAICDSLALYIYWKKIGFKK